MKPTDTNSRKIHLFKMLDITQKQFEQAQAWYKSAQNGINNNVQNSTPQFNLTRINNARYIFDKKS